MSIWVKNWSFAAASSSSFLARFFVNSFTKAWCEKILDGPFPPGLGWTGRALFACLPLLPSSPVLGTSDGRWTLLNVLNSGSGALRVLCWRLEKVERSEFKKTRNGRDEKRKAEPEVGSSRGPKRRNLTPRFQKRRAFEALVEVFLSLWRFSCFGGLCKCKISLHISAASTHGAKPELASFQTQRTAPAPHP